MSSSIGAEANRAVVISDLHIGCGNELANFDEHSALASFIDTLDKRSRAEQRGFELVLAGDVFDFLQMPGYDGFDPVQAEQHFEGILDYSGAQQVVAALRRYAGGFGNTLTVISGNHDPELLVDSVRRRFEAEVGSLVCWADDAVLLPAVGKKWPVWGRALAEGQIWIAHGDRWDPVNAIHRDEFRAAALANRRLSLPAGSRLVLKVLNPLKPTHRWIDTLKPEVSVLVLLWYFEPALVRDYLRQEHGIALSVLRGRIKASLRAGPLFDAGLKDEVSPEPQGIASDSHFDEHLFRALGNFLKQAVAEGADPTSLILDLISPAAPASSSDTLAEHGGAWRKFARAVLQRIEATHAATDSQIRDELFPHAAIYLPASVKLLILGHSHCPRAAPRLQGTHYLNTGTWIPVGGLPPGDVLQNVVALGEGYAWTTSAPRTFVELDWNSTEEPGTLSALLCRFHPGSKRSEPLAPPVRIPITQSITG